MPTNALMGGQPQGFLENLGRRDSQTGPTSTANPYDFNKGSKYGGYDWQFATPEAQAARDLQAAQSESGRNDNNFYGETFLGDDYYKNSLGYEGNVYNRDNSEQGGGGGSFDPAFQQFLKDKQYTWGAGTAPGSNSAFGYFDKTGNPVGELGHGNFADNAFWNAALAAGVLAGSAAYGAGGEAAVGAAEGGGADAALGGLEGMGAGGGAGGGLTGAEAAASNGMWDVLPAASNSGAGLGMTEGTLGAAGAGEVGGIAEAGAGGGWMGKIGDLFTGGGGKALSGLADLYSQNKAKKGYQGLMDQNNDDAYLKQLRSNLMREDAARGRRSDYGSREVQLLASLADLKAKRMPGQLQAMNGVNNANTNMAKDFIGIGSQVPWGKVGGWLGSLGGG